MGSIGYGSAAAERRRWLMMLWRAILAAVGLVSLVPTTAVADSARFDIASQPLPAALKAFADQAHMQVLYPYDAVKDATSNPVRGESDKRAALEQLLRDTGLEAVYSSDSAVTIRPAGLAKTSAAQQVDQAEGAITTAAATQAAPLPQVTVKARRELERRVNRFVAKVTGPTYSHNAVELWGAPLCPALVGLSRSEGEHFFAHMEATMRALGVLLGGIGCKPNFLIVVTSEPEDLISRIATRWPGVFGGPGVEAFIHTPRPVRIWHNASLVDSYGVPASAAYLLGAGRGSDATVGVPVVGLRGLGMTAPRFQYGAVRTFFNGTAIVDRKRVVGFNWDQVADYVAMAALTQVNPDADFGDAPTVLRLFSVPEKDRPAGLTNWDQALLKELYKTDPIWRSQRFDVSQRMMRDIVP